MDLERHAQGGVRCEINVTPLVDVCLVLLIIFMVVTPLIVDPADLPETAGPARLAKAEQALDLAVDANGKVLVAEQAVGPSELRARLQEIHRGSPSRQLVVKADRHLRYEQVRSVLRAASEAGFAGAGLATKKKGAAPPNAALFTGWTP
jgi:biopolymer transport protein ExbD